MKPFNQKTHQFFLAKLKLALQILRGFWVQASPACVTKHPERNLSNIVVFETKLRMARWPFVENTQLQKQKKSWIVLESSASFILIHIERLLHDLLCIFLCQLRDLGAGKAGTVNSENWKI